MKTSDQTPPCTHCGYAMGEREGKPICDRCSTREFQKKDEEARIRVEMAKGYFQDNPLQVIVPDETIKNILLGMKFQPTNINYVTNTVTFKLVK